MEYAVHLYYFVEIQLPFILDFVKKSNISIFLFIQRMFLLLLFWCVGLELMSDEDLVDVFEIQGPGPPAAPRPRNIIPPPPVPGTRDQCLVFASHFDTCNSLKVIFSDVLPSKNNT